MTQEEKAKAYDKALEKARKELQTCGSTNCDAARQIFSLFPELKESEDGENKRISKEITQFLKQNNGWNREWLAWLEKQKTMDKEIIFRPLVGTDIRIAAKQALEKIEIGKEVVLAFNGAYIPVNGKTVGEICNEYDAWLEKQDEKKDNNKLIWKHWSTGIAGNGDGKPIYLIKTGNIYSLSSCLSFECDYIELSELDNLMLEKQGEQKPKDRYTFKSIPRLLEMIKPTDRAKAYCQKLINSLIKEGYVIDAMIVGECLKQMNGKDVPMAIMDEQKPYGQRKECLDCQFNYAGECKGSCQMKRDEQKPIIEMKSAEESLGISSEEYNDIVNECLYGESESSDKVELKFKVGDWITNGDYTWKIIEVKPLDYILQSQDGNIVDDTISHVDEQFHSFTIKDAKDGDVLASELCDSIILFRGIKDDNIDFYCDYDFSKIDIPGDRFTVNNGQHYGNVEDSKDFHPATKEQRDTLFSKMHEAGYEWNAEKKELKKIEQKPQRMVSAEAKEALYDKPTDEEMKELLRTEYEKGRADTIAEMKSSWSEEDLKKPNGGIVLEDFNDGSGFYKVNLAYLNEEQVEEIEELVKRWDLQPELDGDESIISDLLDYFDEDKCLKHEVNDIVKWLKTIKPQPKQKWSEEDNQYLCGLIGLIEQSKAEIPITLKGKAADNCIDWLKSLRPQKQWKPTDEQIKALHDLNVTGGISYAGQGQELINLYNELNKLKG